MPEAVGTMKQSTTVQRMNRSSGLNRSSLRPVCLSVRVLPRITKKPAGPTTAMMRIRPFTGIRGRLRVRHCEDVRRSRHVMQWIERECGPALSVRGIGKERNRWGVRR